MVDAVLPAGGRIEGEFAREAGASVKALITLDGRTLLERGITALRASGRVEHTVVVGPAELAGHAAAQGADAVLPEADSGPANLVRGMEWLRDARGGHAPRVLVLATDLPFAEGGALARFIDACPPDADLTLPLVSRRAFEARFPQSGGEFVRLRDGDWTSGCAYLVNPESALANRIHLERVFAARKSQLALARLLGPLFVARFLTRTLEVRHIQERCERILGCRAAAVADSDPALAFDIDSQEEYRCAAGLLARDSVC